MAAPCPECSPTNQLNHRREWWMSVIGALVEKFTGWLIPKKFDRVLQEWTSAGLFTFMRHSGILIERPIFDHTEIHQRTRVVMQEAAKRGYTLTVLCVWGKYLTNFFVMRGPGYRATFEGLPGLDPVKTTTTVDDKEAARKIFAELGAPAPRGASFTEIKPAFAYAKSLSFPLVVKPRQGSLSAHTKVNIQNEDELWYAIKIAQQVSRQFIVEEYITGNLYRATTVGTKLVAVGRRDPPYVIGDGVSTVQELFNARDAERRQLLVSLGYKPETIPPLTIQEDPARVLSLGERLALTWKINLAYGATVTDVTDDTHPDNRELFERIAVRSRLPSLGIDFIAPDIAVPWHAQRCGFIELNSLPSIDLHHEPIVTGTPRNVAGALLDYVIPPRGGMGC